MQRLNLSGTMMLGKVKCFHFEIVNDYCTEFTPISKNTAAYPFGCDPNEFSNYKANLVTFFYDRTTPPTQQGLQRELEAIGMKYYDMGALIRYQSGRSVSDPYWLLLDKQ